MALEHLVAALEREAETRIGAELDAARAEAASLEAEAGGRIARLRAEALQEQRVRLQQEAERIVAAARREARQKLLLARHRLLDRGCCVVRSSSRRTWREAQRTWLGCRMTWFVP